MKYYKLILSLIIVLFLYLEAYSQNNKNMKIATFGSGCFWCTEAIFQNLKGVDSATSGYCGGTVNDPTYEEVCTGETGHAEVIQLSYDSNIGQTVASYIVPKQGQVPWFRFNRHNQAAVAY